MAKNSILAKTLRFTGILLMGLTGGFTLLGGIGTSCVALNPTGFSENMAKLAPYQWLYILFVLVGIALGILGIRATILLVKGAPGAYPQALYSLAAGSALGILHMAVSRALRGKSMPVDAVVYITVLTLVIFLLMRIPSIWQGVDFNKGNLNSNRPAGGAAAIMLELLTLSIQYLMAPTHTWNGTNYAHAFNISMTVIGSVCVLVGLALMIKRDLPRSSMPLTLAAVEAEPRKHDVLRRGMEELDRKSSHYLNYNCSCQRQP